MKRLAAVCVMLAALWVSAPTYGYVLVYDVYGMLKAVDTQTNDIDRTMIQGYLVAEVDEADNAVVGAEVVLYGRDEENNKVYLTSEAINMALYGNNVVVVGDAGQGGSIVLTGGRMRMWQRNIGIGSRVNVANMLDGDIRVIDGSLFDLDQVLTGASGITAMLDLMQTRSANRAGDALGDVVGDIISRLETRGFVPVVGEEEPGDGEPGMPS
jgi:hypothetical protein